MKILDVIRDSATSSIREEVSRFTSFTLSEYLAEIRQLKQTPRFVERKDVHDAVWGPITLNPGEVLIVDSPIIQRLRRIHHLGLAGLLFPGADYSRFDHTLGTLHIADKISWKLTNDQQYKSKLELDRKYLCPNQITRLAAIFHDCGHTICSHASERFFESPNYSRFSEVRKIKNHFIKNANLTSAKLSEILSLFILTSPAIQELIELAWPFFDNLPAPQKGFDEILGHIAALIIGVPIDYKMLPFCSSISGSIDADKCDYLARDSYRTGVPVAVDLYRVIQKLKLVKKVPNEFGSVWEEHSGGSSENSFLLGIALSAVKSVEEILFSRTLMHEKIYYHHKILASEEMLRKALMLLDQCGFPNIQNFQYVLSLTDHDVISNHPDVFLPALARKESLNEEFMKNTAFIDSCKLLKCLTSRKLLKRCLAISAGIQSAALIQTPESDEVNAFITDIFTDIDINIHSEFVGHIMTETISILQILGKSFEESEIRTGIIVVPSPQVISTDFNIPLEYGGTSVYYREFFQGESWDNSRKTSHAVHYIVGPAHLRPEVFLATEKILFKKYGFLIGKGCLDLAKLNRDHVNRIKQKLIDKGYYSDAIEIMPDELTFSLHVLNRIELLIKRFSGYSGPKGVRVTTAARVTSFIKQFLSKTGEDQRSTLVDGIIRVLESIRILDRGEIVDSLLKTFDEIGKISCGTLVGMQYSALGNLRDSSAHIAYYFNDMKDFFGSSVRPVSFFELMSQSKFEKPIIFFDDAFYSGKQVVSIFEELCLVPREKRVSNEDHGLDFPERVVEKFKQTKIFLCYCYGNERNVSFIRDAIAGLGFNVSVHFANPFPPPLFETNGVGLFASTDQKELVSGVFKEIGYQILETSKSEDGKLKDGWTADRIEQSALGYGNAQQCLVLPWNTPTYTLTALWSKGQLSNGKQWVSLFPRQSKD